MLNTSIPSRRDQTPAQHTLKTVDNLGGGGRDRSVVPWESLHAL